MAYTVAQLITRAYYLSGKVSRGLQTVSGEDLNDGLDLLNALLSFKTSDQRRIPYYKEYQFNAVANQESYFIPNLILAESLTFNIGAVRYSMMSQSRIDYFGSPRVDNIDSLPYYWHVERCLGGANLFMYFLPDQNYPLKLWGKFSLADVTLNQDLSLTLDKFFIEYLRYALAQYICQEFNISFLADNQRSLSEIEKLIFDISPIDLTIQKLSCLQVQPAFNWGDVNIGRGWRPSSS